MSAYLNLDWGQWFYGMWSAVISGGSGAVVSAFAVNMADSEHFNLSTSKFYAVAGTVFLVTGGFNFFSYLHQNPAPKVKTVTTVKTIEAGPPAVVTTVQETRMSSEEKK